MQFVPLVGDQTAALTGVEVNLRIDYGNTHGGGGNTHGGGNLVISLAKTTAGTEYLYFTLR